MSHGIAIFCIFLAGIAGTLVTPPRWGIVQRMSAGWLAGIVALYGAAALRGGF